MGKRFVFVLIAALFIIVSPFASARADYYGYKDAKGIWRYTDDMNSVPVAYRKSVKVVKSEKPPVEKPAAADAAAAAAGDKKAPESAGKAGAEPGKPSVADRLADLNKERDALEKERAALQAERSDLERQRSAAGNKQAQDAVNEKAKAYNDRVKAYDERRQAYEKKVKETVSSR